LLIAALFADLIGKAYYKTPVWAGLSEVHFGKKGHFCPVSGADLTRFRSG